jgi:hypothetical protein
VSLNLDGDMIYHAGASRTFKTVRARVDLKDARRLLVWDPKGRWAQTDRCTAVSTRHDLLRRLRSNPTGPARLAFVAFAKDDFDFWGAAAFWWGRAAGEKGIRTNVLAEEIANVTSPQKAPQGFHQLISQGLEFGITIHVITQSPMESEKTSFRNRTLLRVGQCERDDDAAYLARELRVPREKVDALKPLEYIERDRRTGITKKFSARKTRGLPIWNEVPL